MNTGASSLHSHLERVEVVRGAVARQGLAPWMDRVRQVQVRRFRHTYADLLADGRHSRAAAFFLNELYGSDRFEERDAQFARIVPALERLFPAPVLSLAEQLAEVHALTEELDLALAQTWRTCTPDTPVTRPADWATPYVAAWQQVGRRPERDLQLSTVVDMGHRLARVVTYPGLRTALKLMRGPARAAGLSLLQGVLEEGFDAFRAMGDPSFFLDAIARRERAWMDGLFDAPTQSARILSQCLQNAPET